MVQYGNLYQNDKVENSLSLFGAAEAVEISKPEANPNYARWTNLERLNKERDLIGIYISGHPLDSYKIIIDKVCTTQMTQLEDLTQLANQDITFGGIVTNIKEGQGRDSKPYGIVKMEDYSGSGDIALFGDDWARLRGYFTVGNSLFVTGKVEEKRWKEGAYNLVIGRVEFLSDVKDQKVKSITISIKLNSLTSSTVSELSTIIKRSEGPTEVYFNIIDTEAQSHLTLQSKEHHLSVNADLIKFIEDNDNLDYAIH